MTHKAHYNLYIASCCHDGGIYHYRVNSEGKAEFVRKTDCDRPMYMVIRENKMYVLLRAPFEDNDESGLLCYDIAEDGVLSAPSPLLSTKGQVACHLAVFGETAYVVNYISGSVIKLPDTLVVHKGKGVHPTRQDAPHTHFISSTPDGKYLCVTDLGLDKICLYNYDLTLHSEACVPKGHGVRHLVFSDDGRYLFSANELESTVSSFLYNEGELTYIETISVLPKDFKGESTASAIRFFNGKIYISNRGHNSISVISHSEGKMKLDKMVSCQGDSPRDFDIIDGKIISTNEKSDSVAFIDMNTLEETYKLTEIKSPICIAYREF